MQKYLLIVTFFLLIPILVSGQVRNDYLLDPRNPSETFYHSNMGIPMNHLWNPIPIDSLIDSNGRLVKRSYIQEGLTIADTETWAYYNDGTLKEYFYYYQDNVARHETYNAEGYITELYNFTDGEPIHWYYTYSKFKVKKQTILLMEVYDAEHKIQNAIECDATNGSDIMLRTYYYRWDEQGRMSCEIILTLKSTKRENWYYYYDDGDRDYKSLMDPDMVELKRVYLEK